MPPGARIDRRRRETLDLEALTFTPVTAATWPRFEAFFSGPGAPKHCWCMVWRRTSEEAKLQDGADRKRMMKARVEAGTPVGLLASIGEQTVGWVSIGPRESHRNLGGPPAEEGERIWSLACFYVPRRFRGQALVRRLIVGAVDHARSAGATLVEAYPVDEDAPSYRFMGFVGTFLDAGFHPAGRAGVRRHVMRLPVAGKL
ncbi:MAG: GNAT family N-acetyltransferase [Rhizobiales bacterium]|nr:GNAT family N-acetyltransferase [Hyphomicrobiales bacterium]